MSRSPGHTPEQIPIHVFLLPIGTLECDSDFSSQEHYPPAAIYDAMVTPLLASTRCDGYVKLLDEF